MVPGAASFSVSAALPRRCKARSRRSFRRCSWPTLPSCRSLRHESRPSAERRAWQHADICGSASTASTDVAPNGPACGAFRSLLLSYLPSAEVRRGWPAIQRLAAELARRPNSWERKRRGCWLAKTNKLNRFGAPVVSRNESRRSDALASIYAGTGCPVLLDRLWHPQPGTAL
jgi:hypothetical protein